MPRIPAPHHLLRGSRQPRMLRLGSRGQIGQELWKTLRVLGPVVAPYSPGRRGLKFLSQQVDLAKPQQIRAVVRQVKPQWIINAAAFTAVDQAELEPQRAMTVNAVAPGILAEEARRLGAALLHFSTDYIFDGSGQLPWKEGDQPHPLNVYGTTKLAGEEAIRAADTPHLILRLCWVHSAHGENFVKKILKLAHSQHTLQVVDDQIGAPTSAQLVAQAAAQIIQQSLPDPWAFLQSKGGAVHLACQGETSWHEFAVEICRLGQLYGLPLQVKQLLPISSRDFCLRAERPQNSRLDCSLLASRFGLALPEWQLALRQTFQALYPQTTPLPHLLPPLLPALDLTVPSRLLCLNSD